MFCVCCENVNCTGKINRRTQNLIFAGVSGFLFAFGWWLYIDSACVHIQDFYACPFFIVPGLLITLCFCLVNFWLKLAWGNLNAGAFLNRNAECVIKSILLIIFFVIFCTFFMSIIFCVMFYHLAKPKPTRWWPYTVPILQTIFIGAAAFLYFLGIDTNYM